MSWFITEDAEALTKAAPAAPADFWESAGAAWRADAIDADRRGRLAAEEWSILGPMSERYLEEKLQGRWKNGLLPSGEDPELDRLFALAAADQDRPAHFPATREDFVARVDARLKKEQDDARAINRMGGWWSETLGGMGSATATPLGAASLLVGGPTALGAKTFIGGVARTAAFEGAMGGAGATLDLSDKYRMADRLGLERPNAMAEIGMGVAGGAIVGGALGAGARGVDYALRRRDIGAPPPGVELRDHLAASDAAARALETGAPLPLPPAPPARPTLTPELVEAVIWQESRGRARAVGPVTRSGESAQGLMQVMPATARDPGHGVTPLTGTDEEILAQLMDPAVNRRFGEEYLGAMLRRYENLEDALVAYNWGPGNADQWVAGGRRSADLPRETADYVTSIRRRMATQDQATPSAPMDWDHPAPTINAGGVRLPPTMTTPSGSKIDVTFEVIDLAQLRAATGDLQPRDRTRAASREQIAHMAADLDPDLLMPSPVMSHGAPLIGPDDIVESGNGRIAALREAAERPETGRYAAYLDSLRNAGFDVPATGRPVLVARRTTELDAAGRRALVTDANASSVMRFSPTEQALSDADALPMEALAQFETGGQIFTPEGRAFVKSMFARLPQAERAGLYTASGGLNAAGRQRIEAAVFARAYEAPDLIAALTETPDAASAGMVRALTEVAPHWASLRHEIAGGRIDPRFDVTADLTAAVRTIAQARRDAAAQKRPVATVLSDALRQSDIERGAPSEAQKAFVEAFYDGGRARSAGQTAAMLRGYVDSARRQSDPTPDLFGAPAEPSALEALAAGARRAAEILKASRSEEEVADSMPESDALGDLTRPPPSRIIIDPSDEIDLSVLPPEAQNRLRDYAAMKKAELRTSAARNVSEAEIVTSRGSYKLEPLARYSDPSSGEAEAVAAAHMRELREQIRDDPDLAKTELVDDAGETLLDEGEPMTIARLLADLDADADLATAVKFCGRTR